MSGEAEVTKLLRSGQMDKRITREYVLMEAKGTQEEGKEKQEAVCGDECCCKSKEMRTKSTRFSHTEVTGSFQVSAI